MNPANYRIQREELACDADKYTLSHHAYPFEIEKRDRDITLRNTQNKLDPNSHSSTIWHTIVSLNLLRTQLTHLHFDRHLAPIRNGIERLERLLQG